MIMTIEDLVQRGTAGPITYYAEPDHASNPHHLWVQVIRCGGEFDIRVYRLENLIVAFDYTPREPAPDGPLDAATVTRLVREAIGDPR